MKLFLSTAVLSVLACIGLSPPTATADPFSCDRVEPIISFLSVDQAAACTSSVIWAGWHDGHIDCIYVDYTFRHGC